MKTLLRAAGLAGALLLAATAVAAPTARLDEPSLVNGRLVYPEGAAIPRHATAIEQQFLETKGRPKALRQPRPPSGPLHCVAEYEPMEAILVSWEGPVGWRNVLARMGASITTIGDAELHVSVDGTIDRADAETRLATEGANMAGVEFITAATDSIWMRDYGPRYAFEGDVRVIVDHTYNRPRPDDDSFPESYGQWRNHAQYVLPLVHGGGNFHLTANALGWATRLIANENPDLTEADIRALWRDYQGLDTMLLDAYPATVDATQHLDMWALPVADDRILISDWPLQPGSVQDTICDAAAIDFEARGFQVFRVPAFSVDGTHYTYTNAVLCNGIAIVPQYADPVVAPSNILALDAFQAALPSRTIIPIDAQGIVTASGVVHCIVMHVPAARGGGSPTALLQAPGACEALMPGTDAEIRWISDDDVATSEVDILLSLDGGSSFPISVATALPDTGSFTWRVPDVATNIARLRIVVRDGDGNQVETDSLADFIVRPSGPVTPAPIDPLLVAKGLPGEVELSIGAVDPLPALNVYEGEIGTWYGSPRTWCHVSESDRRFGRGAPGRVTITDVPLPEDRWFLLTSADCLSETPLPRFATSCGPTP